MPVARRFSTAVGSAGARELVGVARCAASQRLRRLPVPIRSMFGARGQRSRLVGAGRLMSVGNKNLENLMFAPLQMLVVDGRWLPYHRRVVNYKCGERQADAHWDHYCATDPGACWGRSSLKRARAGLIGLQVWLGYWCFDRSRR